MRGKLFGDFSGMTKKERKKDVWRRVLVDVIAWGGSWGIATFVFGFILTSVYYGFGFSGTEGMLEEIGGAKSGIFTVLITSFLGALVFGAIALFLGLLFGFLSGLIDARIGGLMGISFGRGVGLGTVAALLGLVEGVLVVVVMGIIFAISGGTGSDVLEFVGIDATGDQTWAIIVAIVVIVVGVCVLFTLKGFILGVISGAIAGIGNLFLKGKSRVFSEIVPAVLVLTATGLLMGLSTASSTGSVLAIFIGIVAGVISGVLFGLMIGLFRYVIPERFLKRPISVENGATG